MELIFGTKRLCLLVALCALSANQLAAQTIHETGTLRDFLGGACPNCEYDNWISHISEGIANPGYNNYGPTQLDPQTNGFGLYLQIPSNASGDSLIAIWYSIFDSFLMGDTTSVQLRLTDTGLDSIYQLVILSDPSRQYYILREILNPAFYDSQLTPLDTTDDVRGSFTHGWGVYVFAPSASLPDVLVEAPHPEDDYVSVFVAVDVFETYDAGLLMIAGAGREVLWTNQGEYNNSKSLSDPSRVYNSVFNTAHRSFVDHHADHFCLQLHSYDSDAHQGQRSLVISSGSDDDFPNEPVLDRCALDDMISFTPFVCVPANSCGNHPDVTISQYYQLFYEGGYAYRGEAPIIPTTNDLYGFAQNQQALYSNAGTRKYQDPEDFLHIEMDEMPDPILDTITVYYQTELPGQVTFENYSNAIAYFHPAFQALQRALPHVAMAQVIGAVPDPLAFPQTLVYAVDTLVVRFRNQSATEMLYLTDVYTNDQVFIIESAPIGSLIDPGRECPVTVLFNPQGAYTYQRVLTFSTEIGCRHVPLVGTGLGGVAQLAPSSVNFGPVSLTETDTTTVLLQNIGNFPMSLSAVINAPPHFSFEPFAIPDSLIADGQQLPLRIRFDPLDIGSYQDTMYIIVQTYSTDTLALEVKGEGAIVVDIFSDDFSLDHGWTGYGLAGEWARGVAMGGLGDDNYGGPDPAFDHTPSIDNILIGNDLTAIDGDYEANLASPYWLTSPVINCSSYVNVQLKFWQWLGVERNQYDHAFIQAFNGTDWVTKWQNSTETIDEDTWTQHLINVSHEADQNPVFRIRFGIGTTDGSWQYCGWNIDDLRVIGVEPTLAAITSLCVMPYEETSIFLCWNRVLYAQHYNVYRGSSPDFAISPEYMIAEIPANDTTYVDTDVLDQMPNAFYKVTSLDQ